MTTKRETSHHPAVRQNPASPETDTNLNPLSGLWAEARKRVEEKARLRREHEENLRKRAEALAAERARYSHD